MYIHTLEYDCGCVVPCGLLQRRGPTGGAPARLGARIGRKLDGFSEHDETSVVAGNCGPGEDVGCGDAEVAWAHRGDRRRDGARGFELRCRRSGHGGAAFVDFVDRTIHDSRHHHRRDDEPADRRDDPAADGGTNDDGDLDVADGAVSVGASGSR